jgi:hypothetical protein
MNLSKAIHCEAHTPVAEKIKSPFDSLGGISRPIQIDKTKVSKKRSWKKPKGKPKRPLSAYNLFFQSERNNLLATLPTVNCVNGYAINEHKKISKRRKAHGKIGFAELAQEVAKKWKSLDESEKAIYEALAFIEKERYREILENWKISQGYISNREQAYHSKSFPKDFSDFSTNKFPLDRFMIHDKSSFPYLNSESLPANLKQILSDTTSSHSCCSQSLRNSQNHQCELKQHHFEANKYLDIQKVLMDEFGKQRLVQNIESEGSLDDGLGHLLDDDSSIESAELDAYMDDSFYDDNCHNDSLLP